MTTFNMKKFMTTAGAAAIALTAIGATLNGASAMPIHRVTEGQAINDCRQALYPSGDAHNRSHYQAMRACEARVEQGQPAVSGL
jgi:hypothetical protein